MIKKILTALLPAPFIRFGKYFFEPSTRQSWGGPFNGQLQRQKIVRDVLQGIDLQLIVETGTFRGTTTQWFVDNTSRTVHTVEYSPEYWGYCIARFVFTRRVRLERGTVGIFCDQ